MEARRTELVERDGQLQVELVEDVIERAAAREARHG